jgi:hypothetical protein
MQNTLDYARVNLRPIPPDMRGLVGDTELGRSCKHNPPLNQPYEQPLI